MSGGPGTIDYQSVAVGIVFRHSARYGKAGMTLAEMDAQVRYVQVLLRDAMGQMTARSEQWRRERPPELKIQHEAELCRLVWATAALGGRVP